MALMSRLTRAIMLCSALGFLMFCVGINTKVEQFQQVAREPRVSITREHLICLQWVADG